MPSGADQAIGHPLGDALFLAHQLITVEIGGFVPIHRLQFLQVIPHGLEHGVVVVQSAARNLEQILNALHLFCLAGCDLFVIRCPQVLPWLQRKGIRMRPMDDAFALVAHPQLLVAIGAVLLLSTALLIGFMAALQAWPLHHPGQPDPTDADAAPLGPEAYDWLYE